MKWVPKETNPGRRYLSEWCLDSKRLQGTSIAKWRAKQVRIITQSFLSLQNSYDSRIQMWRLNHNSTENTHTRTHTYSKNGNYSLFSINKEFLGVKRSICDKRTDSAPISEELSGDALHNVSQLTTLLNWSIFGPVFASYFISLLCYQCFVGTSPRNHTHKLLLQCLFLWEPNLRPMCRMLTSFS